MPTITLERARQLHPGDVLHYDGPSPRGWWDNTCRVEIGPRGGRTEHAVRVRITGALREWKRSGDWRLPVKRGFYESDAVTRDNAGNWHLPADCPAGLE